MTFVEFQNRISDFIQDNQLTKIVLSKKRTQSQRWRRVDIVPFEKSSKVLYSITKLTETQSFTENRPEDEFIKFLFEGLNNDFQHLNLLSKNKQLQVKASKKADRFHFKTLKVFANVKETAAGHDRLKADYLNNLELLFKLGVCNKEGRTKSGMTGKRRQINRFVEIIHHRIKSADSLHKKSKWKIVDMGAGKAYLTISLHDFLSREYPEKKIEMLGVEIRSDLVDYAQKFVEQQELSDIQFVCSDISDILLENAEIVIALHACDTATDLMLHKAIVSSADLIACSPCCHKEIRQQLKSKPPLEAITRHGIFAERQAELLTDTIRELLLQKSGYLTKAIEFVESEHSGKNILLLATKSNHKMEIAKIEETIVELKNMFGVKRQRLEQLLSELNN